MEVQRWCAPVVCARFFIYILSIDDEALEGILSLSRSKTKMGVMEDTSSLKKNTSLAFYQVNLFQL